MNVRFDVSGLTQLRLHYDESASNLETNLHEVFTQWSEDVAEIMRDEVPVDEGDLRDSIELERRTPLRSVIRPTKTVRGKGGTEHNLGFVIEHGPGNRAPNPFMMRTYLRAKETAPTISVSDVL